MIEGRLEQESLASIDRNSKPTPRPDSAVDRVGTECVNSEYSATTVYSEAILMATFGRAF